MEHTNTSSLFIAPIKHTSLSGTIAVPSSKSHSIRALLLAAMAKGSSTINNILLSGDTVSCINVLTAWGVKSTILGQSITIDSPGLHNLQFNSHLARTQSNTKKHTIRSNNSITIDVGNSGTTLYLATALAALGNTPVYFTGDASIQKRSAKDLLVALKQLGATITYHNTTEKQYYAPYSITGPIQAGNVSLSCPTSQYLSALLIALSFLENKSTIHAELNGEFPYIDMTLQWLERFHVPVQNQKQYRSFTIQGSSSIAPFHTTISGDYSSAAFFICATALFNDTITITGLDKDDIQADKKILAILKHMGIHFYWHQNSQGGWSLSKKTETQHSHQLPQLSGGTFNLQDIPDSLPILAVCACFAKQPITFTGVAHARIKETDRIAIMTKELTQLGVQCQEHADGMTIYPSTIQGGTIHSHGDHRIAMAFAIAALRSQKGITIQDYTVAEITYPTFYATLKTLGATYNVIQT